MSGDTQTRAPGVRGGDVGRDGTHGAPARLGAATFRDLPARWRRTRSRRGEHRHAWLIERGGRVVRRRAPARRVLTRAPRYPERGGIVGRFALGLLAGVAALVLFAYVVGKQARVGLGDPVEAVLKAATSTGTAVAIAFALLVLVVWCGRRLWLERLAWRPGSVEVADFAGAEGVDARHLTAAFRRRLATLRLHSPAPVPGTAPEAGFLDVLGAGAMDSANPLSAVVGLLRAAKPTHAYRVQGELIRREGAAGFGVTVQVIRMPDQGTPPDTVWDISWERAIRRAADRATAQILPRTRRCAAPWASWRGYVMPPALLEAYEDGVEHESARRYDRALSRYFDALEMDPMNLMLRLQVGQLQEKLGLFLDAMGTYEGIVQVVRHDEEWRARGLYTRVATRERARAVAIARYRRVVLLGGPALAAQWRTVAAPGARTERDVRRETLRASLRAGLEEQLEQTAAAHARGRGIRRKGRTAVADLLDVEAAGDPDALLRELRELFVLRALDELPAVRAALRRVGRRADDRTLFTRTSLSFTERCMTERHTWLVRQLGERPARWIWGDDEVRALRRAVCRAGGPRGLRHWHEHYNAACTLALPLLVEDRDGDQPAALREGLARDAVAHLAQATTCADSGYIATRRDWLLSEDPDLDGLRTHDVFKAFEALYFPSGRAAPRRPRDVQRLEVARYTGELLEDCARGWQAVWRERRGTLPPTPTLIEWWEDERRAWELVGRVAWNFRHWVARRDLICEMETLRLKHGGEPLDVCFGEFVEEPAPPGAGDPDGHARQAIARSDGRLSALARSLSRDPQAGRFALRGLDGWIARLRELDGDGLSPSEAAVVRLCDRHAALWAELRVWLASEGDGDGPEAAAFRRDLDRLEARLRTPAVAA